MQTAYKFNVEQTKPWVSDCSTVINVRTNQTTGLRFGSEEKCAKLKFVSKILKVQSR